MYDRSQGALAVSTDDFAMTVAAALARTPAVRPDPVPPAEDLDDLDDPEAEFEASEAEEGAGRDERGVVAAHYENRPDVFSLVLGSRLDYVSGIFHDEGEDLESAQIRRYAWIAEQLDIRPGDEVLDAGCGWGSNLLYLAEHTQGRFRGVTPSTRQRQETLARAVKRGLTGRVRVELADIEDVELEESSLDVAMLVGCVNHHRDRALIHRRIARALRPGGRLLVSDSFMARETALGGRQPLHLSDEIALLEDCGLHVARVRDLTTSYAGTLRRWLENVQANRQRIEELSPGFARVLRTYMTIARLSFCTRTALEYVVVAGKA